jgi:hypothetical protein
MHSHATMTTENDQIQSRAKQRAQEIQKIQAEGHQPATAEDLGSPAEDDGEDATTRFKHEVERAKERAIANTRAARSRRPR